MRLTREPRPPPDLDLHLVDLDADGTPTGEARAVLAIDEQARAERFRSPQDGRRFVLRRLHLRRRLADRLGCDPAAVRFAYGPFGKPSLAGAGPSFSTSHSGGQALIVVAERGPVGCDIERIDPGFDWRGTLRAEVLTPQEAGRLAALPPGPAAVGFFGMWTLKEACLKCSGGGLSAAARTVATDGLGGADAGDADVRAAALRLHPDYAAAVAWAAG